MPHSDSQPHGSTNGNRPALPVAALEPEPEQPAIGYRYGRAGLLLLSTAITTLLTGIQLQNDFNTNQPPFTFAEGILPLGWIAQHPSRLLLGVPFSATLLLILLSHEMGHFVACRRYGVQATLPYFIPFPNLFGTLGAFIRILSPFPSRAVLFDIGIAGPIAGFLVAVPALVLGLGLSKIDPEHVSASQLPLGYPLIFHLVRAGEGIHWPMSSIYLHPVALAAWVGMLATSLNLLPASQLDGGHILYAVWPRAHRAVTYALVVALLLVGLFWWSGWLIWVCLLLLFGANHPPVVEQPGLNAGRKWLAVSALLIFVLTFMRAPAPGNIDWHKVSGKLHRVVRWLHSPRS